MSYAGISTYDDELLSSGMSPSAVRKEGGPTLRLPSLPHYQSTFVIRNC